MSRNLLQATAIVGALALIPLGTSAMAQVDTETYRELDKFMDVYNRIKADYVEPVDDKTLVKGAIDGMLAALDPHSSYEDGLDYQNLEIQTQGNYGGLGLTVTLDSGLIKVIAPTMDWYQNFIFKTLMKMPGVVDVQSTVTMHEMKYVTALPVRGARAL